MLNGFNFAGIQDAGEVFLTEGLKNQGEIENQDINIEFTNMLTSMVKPVVEEQESDEEDHEEEEEKLDD